MTEVLKIDWRQNRNDKKKEKIPGAMSRFGGGGLPRPSVPRSDSVSRTAGTLYRSSNELVIPLSFHGSYGRRPNIALQEDIVIVESSQ